MPYALLSDTHARDPVWRKLANARRGPLYDTLKAAYVDMLTEASHHLTNGYLTAEDALELARDKPKVLELLCTPALGEPPKVHRQGDECACLGDEWVDGYDYRIHGFLKRNPSKAEYERNKAMKADRKDARLRALVYERDGGCCRYCRSGPLPPNAGRSKDRRKVRSFDHVNPDQAAGPNGEGYVLACDRCNSEKGARLPHEADMVLLDEPTAEEKAAWAERGLALFDRAEIAPETLRERDPERDDGRDRKRDPETDAETDRGDEALAEVHPEAVEARSQPRSARSENPPGSGRAPALPQPATDPPPRKPLQAQPVRSSADPDIYTRRSRSALPPWPPGSAIRGARLGTNPPDEGETPWT